MWLFMKNGKYIYEGNLEADSLVLYQGSEGWTSQIDTVHGYLHAADILVQNLNYQLEQYSETSAIHDELVLPLLNLHIHSIEISLKLLVHRLKDHAIHNCCGYTKANNFDFNKVILSHDLNKIIENLDTIIPIQGELHFFKYYQDIKKCALDLYIGGVTSVNTRYSIDKNGKPSSLLQKRINIRIFKVHNDVNDYCKKIIDFVDRNTDNELNKCELDEYTASRLDELKKCEKLLIKHGKLFKEANDSRAVFHSDKPFNIITWPDITFEQLKHTEKEDLLFKSLKSLSKEELAHIVCGLCFIRPVTTIQSPSIKIAVCKEQELVEKAFNLRDKYNLALELLRRHMIEVEEKIKLIEQS